MRARLASPPGCAPVRVVIVTLDNHLAGAAERAAARLSESAPGITIGFHAASDWASDPHALARARADIARGDVILATMLFMEEHIAAVMPQLQARRPHCDAIVGAMSAAEVVKLTRLGPYDMAAPAKGPIALLKKLRGKAKPGGSVGAGQMAMLRRLPKLLKHIPGKAQDVRAYFLTLQYWLSGSDANFEAMIRALVDRYAAGPRAGWRGKLGQRAPEEYPETGVYHPALPGRMAARADALPRDGDKGTVGLLLLRSYVLAGDAAHYDGVIAAMEARGLRVIPAFASGLDSRPAIEAFFAPGGKVQVDAVVSLTGFSLVGGPAYNDAGAAEAVLAGLDVPYVAAHPLEFQTLGQWAGSTRGLMPIEATMMVAIPELDGAAVPTMFGGRAEAGGECNGCARQCRFPAETLARAMHACPERAEALAGKTAKLIALRRTAAADRKLGIVLFNFPPNSGAAGTAAHLAVWESLWGTLRALKADGYAVELPGSVDDLRSRVLEGNAARFGADANVHQRVPADEYVRREPHLAAIEREWGPAPGRLQADGRSVHILGAQFGNVFVGLQPALGYEGDPMRLLFERSFAPTHAMSAFYRWLREDFAADAVLHFGTHGALEFLPGKQAGMSSECWPERLIGDLPNFYLYAANNPSEGLLAKRRAGATLISYLTPPLAQAGVYRGLADLKATLNRWRAGDGDRAALAELLQAQAASLDMAAAEPAWTDPEAQAAALGARVLEVEGALIPEGLHVVGEGMDAAQRAQILGELAANGGLADAERARIDAELARNGELAALTHALSGGYVRPAPGGDVLRRPEVLPTGRNLYGFDPYRIPSAYAVADGQRAAARLIARAEADTGRAPQSVAMVLWGCDNMKSEGAQLAQALALIGARPRFDGYGRLAGAELIPLGELGRARVDVVLTLSGIFRDLLPLQTKLLAEAALLAARAEDEPAHLNPIRAHALAHAQSHNVPLEAAALRVFSNAEGSYGANVNMMIDAGTWDDAVELGHAYSRRKGFAYGADGRPSAQPGLLDSVLAHVDLAYQNLDSVELGITDIDQYVDSLGGIAQAVERARGMSAPIYIGDATQGQPKVRTLAEQVALESRTRTLNPKWYEGMLRHGAEGVRHIEAHVTTTFGWSATAQAVEPWVYERISETFVLDPEMRERLTALNPKASARVANRLIEASDRQFWSPDAETLAALHAASDAIEDRLEGIAA